MNSTDEVGVADIQNYLRSAMNVAYVTLADRFGEPPTESECRQFVQEQLDAPLPVGPAGINGKFPFETVSGSQVI